jgi:hypothetical protein
MMTGKLPRTLLKRGDIIEKNITLSSVMTVTMVAYCDNCHRQQVGSSISSTMNSTSTYLYKGVSDWLHN